MLNGLIFAIFGATSLWAGIDSHRLKIPADSKPYSWNNGGAAWLFSCLLLWIAAFPYYLYKRTKALEERGEPRERTRRVALIGGAAIAALLLAIAAGSIHIELETAEMTLAKAISKEIQAGLDADPRFRGTRVKDLVFSHRRGNEYTGDLMLENAGRREKHTVAATYNGLTYTFTLSAMLETNKSAPPKPNR